MTILILAPIVGAIYLGIGWFIFRPYSNASPGVATMRLIFWLPLLVFIFIVLWRGRGNIL